MMVTIQAEDPKVIMKKLNDALAECVKDTCLTMAISYESSMVISWDPYQKTSLEDEEDK